MKPSDTAILPVTSLAFALAVTAASKELFLAVPSSLPYKGLKALGWTDKGFRFLMLLTGLVVVILGEASQGFAIASLTTIPLIVVMRAVVTVGT